MRISWHPDLEFPNEHDEQRQQGMQIRKVPRADGYFVKSAQIESFENSQFTFQVITPHARELLPSCNVVPY